MAMSCNKFYALADKLINRINHAIANFTTASIQGDIKPTKAFARLKSSARVVNKFDLIDIFCPACRQKGKTVPVNS